MALIDNYNLIIEGGLVRERAAVAIASAAVAISGESDQTANYAARQKWAIAALRDPLEMAKRMMWGIVSVSRAGKETSDENIASAVASLVDHYAKLEA